MEERLRKEIKENMEEYKNDNVKEMSLFFKENDNLIKVFIDEYEKDFYFCCVDFTIFPIVAKFLYKNLANN